MATYDIGEAARRTGLPASKLRYYERIGLVERVARRPNGRRAYSDDDLWWLGFVSILASTGMSIRDLVAFAQLERSGDATLSERRAILLRQRTALRASAQRLSRYLDAVEQKLEHYRA
jgi:DNA-binding transcriptional MerR regulator